MEEKIRRALAGEAGADLDAIRASGQSVLGYREFWERASGVNPEGATARHHRDILGLLFLSLQVDQLNVYNLMAFELACRQLLRGR